MARRLGQHFLTSSSALSTISSAACKYPEAPIIEIGPGKGALTGYLVECASRLVAVELDQVLVHYLTERFRGHPNVTVVNADILSVDLSTWGEVSVVGNLPYYITSPIVEKVVRLGPRLLNAVFLIQLEVAERIAARPGSREYGYFSVLVQTFCDTEILLRVPPGAFRPPPKVDSAVLQLRPRAAPAIPDVEAFLKFCSAAFQAKRKTLRNNLSAAYSKQAIDAQPDAGRRAEQLSLEELNDLHQRILRFS